MTFDYNYWGIYKENLEKCEEIIQELVNQYELTMNDLQNIEEIAKASAQELFPYAHGFDNLTNLINTEKIKAAIGIICQKYKLDEENFDYTVDGNIIKIIYDKTYIA